MSVTLYFYRAKADQMEAILALYREWRQLVQEERSVSAELLSRTQDPAEMIMLVRFEDQATAWAVAESADYRAWYSRLVHLAEMGPIVSQYEII